jgi:lysozyme family protein
MQHSFNALAGGYTAALAAMIIDADRMGELQDRARIILDRAAHQDYPAVVAKTGVPALWGMASFERESGSDYSRSPAQGDRWDRISTHVPRGLGPYRSWAEAAIAAYRIDRLETVGAGNWTWARACYEGELFNGFGPRSHGRHTGYLWAGTNIYNGGKYVEDGVWDPRARDRQFGMVPLMAAMLRLDPSLALDEGTVPATAGVSPASAAQEENAGGTPAVPAAVPGPLPAPTGLGGGDRDTQWLQQQLNRLGADPPLIVDGSYGRHTRRAVAAFQVAHEIAADGIAGPLTVAEIEGRAR